MFQAVCHSVIHSIWESDSPWLIESAIVFETAWNTRPCSWPSWRSTCHKIKKRLNYSLHILWLVLLWPYNNLAWRDMSVGEIHLEWLCHRLAITELPLNSDKHISELNILRSGHTPHESGLLIHAIFWICNKYSNFVSYTKPAKLLGKPLRTEERGFLNTKICAVNGNVTFWEL